jgi:hypothetical protein
MAGRKAGLRGKAIVAQTVETGRKALADVLDKHEIAFNINSRHTWTA